MTYARRSAAVGLALLLTGCGAAEKATEPPPSQPAPVPVARPVAADMATAVSGFDAFGLDLLAAPTLAREPNLVVSPVSVSIALQLVGAGAQGETAAQIRKVLRLPDDSLPPLPAFDQTDLKVSNTAWAQQGLELRSDYRDALRDRFATALREADFVGDPNGARGRINQTVAEQTAGRITDLFPEESITVDTRLVLTNALYLKADWAREFPADATRDAPFTRDDGSTVPVPMMHLANARLGYAEGPGYQVVTLPYRGGKLAFDVIVPASVDTLRAKGIATILDEVRPASVTLAMPRFTARSGLNLSETLRAAGMPDAFSDTAADFSGITEDTELHIDSVQHKTFVRVDEKGTEAAAATGVDAQATSATVGRTVTVDRPFLFVITDTTTGAPLFLGRIADPTTEGA